MLPVRAQAARGGVLYRRRTDDAGRSAGGQLAPGAIYNSNRFTLRALLENLGCTITDFGIVPDTLEATRDTLRSAARENDLIITSGGVSVGEEDHIKPAVEAEGRLNMWQIAVKPGKPLAFRRSAARRRRGVFPRPARQSGVELHHLPAVRAAVHPAPARRGRWRRRRAAFAMRADFDWPKADRRNEFLRARINDAGGLDLFPNQGSGVLTSTVWGDGLIDNPPGQPIARGDSVRFIPFSELLH